MSSPTNSILNTLNNKFPIRNESANHHKYKSLDLELKLQNAQIKCNLPSQSPYSYGGSIARESRNVVLEHSLGATSELLKARPKRDISDRVSLTDLVRISN